MSSPGDELFKREDLAKLNLGCGWDILPGWVNVDAVKLDGVDVVCDLDGGPWPWEDASVPYIKASHVFEHVSDPVLFMCESWRVLAPRGILDIRCPYYQHPNSATDPTHKRHCTHHTWEYWCPGLPLHQAYGPAMGGDTATFEVVLLTLNGYEWEEIQCVLRKLG